MALFSLNELFDVIVMTLVVGFIFKDSFQRPREGYDPLKKYNQFDWNNLWFSILVTAPAVIFHELAHKFVAMAMGLVAVFHAAYTWLAVGLVMKLLNTGFIFLVPGFVSTAGATPMQHALIAFAGPALNGVLYLTGFIVLQTQKKLSHKSVLLWALTKRINGFLFIFNMIPIPGFDGFNFFTNLSSIF